MEDSSVSCATQRDREATIPRSGGGIYSKGSPSVVSGTTIQSAAYNTTIDDLVTDANAARPVSAGGTGAANAADARTNLGATVTGAAVFTAADAAAARTAIGISATNTPFTPTGSITSTNVQSAIIEAFGETNYDVDVRHGLDGTTGDIAKIEAAIAAAPLGATLHFPNKSTPFNRGITLNRQLNTKFHGTVFRIEMGADTTSDLWTIDIPAANTVSGDLRRMNMDGLIIYSITGGNNAINLKKGGVGQASLICTFENLLAYSGANANGYAFRISDIDSHWNVMRSSLFAGRGIGHFGADGWKFEKCQFIGNLGIDFQLVEGAFLTTVEGCTGAMDELAFWIRRGSNIRFMNNSWEQAPLANTGVYNVQGLIQPGFSNTIHGVSFADNFGAGANVGSCLRLDAGGGAVYDTNFDGCVFHPGSTSLDVQIVSAAVYQTRFGTSNIYRGTRAGADPTWPLSISDSGTSTIGNWASLTTKLTLSNGWTAAANSRVMICPHTRDIKFDAALVPGTLTAGTVIGTLAVGYRPHKDTLIPVTPNSGTATMAINISTAGVISVFASNYVGTYLSLTPIRYPAAVVATYTPGA